MKLYSYPDNKNCWKSLIAAKYVEVDIAIAPDFVLGATNRTPEFLQLNPHGKVRKYE